MLNNVFKLNYMYTCKNIHVQLYLDRTGQDPNCSTVHYYYKDLWQYTNLWEVQVTKTQCLEIHTSYKGRGLHAQYTAQAYTLPSLIPLSQKHPPIIRIRIMRIIQ